MARRNAGTFGGRYEVRRPLGSGSIADVYLAHDQRLYRDVALKVVFPGVSADAGFVERLRRAMPGAAALDHVNIVRVHEWGQVEGNGTWFVAMEYVEGHSLADRLRALGRLEPEHAATIGVGMAGGLAFAHRKGVLHGAVTPRNVLIGGDGDIKMADFGLNRAAMANAGMGFRGDVTYCSPEQLQGGSVGLGSDVYGLGCVLYEMATGRPPFSGDNAVAIAHKHRHEEPVRPRAIDPVIPPALEAIILRCLAKDAGARPSARWVHTELVRYPAPAIRQGSVRTQPSPSRAPTKAKPRSGDGRAGDVPPRPTPSGHVFISYSRDDRGYVERLIGHLHRHGVRTWSDTGIESGDRWTAAIERAMRASSAVVVVMTPAAQASTWVERELHLAEELKKPLLPLLLDGLPWWSLADIQHERVVGGRMPSGLFVDRLRRFCAAGPRAS